MLNNLMNLFSQFGLTNQFKPNTAFVARTTNGKYATIPSHMLQFSAHHDEHGHFNADGVYISDYIHDEDGGSGLDVMKKLVIGLLIVVGCIFLFK